MQLVMDGIFLGSIYALFAIGFTLVFGILDQLNLAHASVFSAGALVGIELVTLLGISIWLVSRSCSSSGRCSASSSSGSPSGRSRAARLALRRADLLHRAGRDLRVAAAGPFGADTLGSRPTRSPDLFRVPRRDPCRCCRCSSSSSVVSLMLVLTWLVAALELGPGHAHHRREPARGGASSASTWVESAAPPSPSPRPSAPSPGCCSPSTSTPRSSGWGTRSNSRGSR